MKEFSKELEQSREFEIGGELFRWRYPFWEEVATIFDEDVELLRNGKPIEEMTTKESIERTINRIVTFIDPGDEAHKRFRALTKRKTNPLPLFQISDLYRWLLEVATGRPTSQPSDSGAGPTSSEASSPGESS